MNTAVILTVCAAWTGTMLFMAWSLINLRAQLDRKIDELTMERRKTRGLEEKITQTELRVQAFAVKMAPLIAKTDWMTGRWGGQFDTLVRLENQRNADVEVARKALWDIPLVKREALRNPFGTAQPLTVQPYTTKDNDK